MKLKEMLDAIEAKKSEIRNLVESDKLEDAQAMKEELDTLQNKFDLLKQVTDPNGDGTVEAPENAAEIPQEMEENKMDAIKEFANAARHSFKNMNNEETPAAGGYTVPEDISTKVEQFKDAKFSLRNLVKTEKVSTLSGSRTYQVKGGHTGFDKVGEAGKIKGVTGPSFTRVDYKVEKYAGYLPVTNELLADSDANIANTLIEWLGEEGVATDNALILGAVAQKSATAISGIDGIKKAINVTLGQAYAGSVKIVTNDDGLNYLDTLKDENGRYLLQPIADPASPIKLAVAVGAHVIPLVVVPNAVLATEANAVPFIIGDLESYCRLFDRAQLTLSTSTQATVGTGEGDTQLNAFEEDLTIFRAIERLDVRVIDANAIVNGTITVQGN